MALTLREAPTRLELAADQPVPGASPAGISEEFPLDGARTIYGASKLAAELLIEEWRAGFGLLAVVNRCGVIAGPWQMGRVDQGVFALWLIAHRFGRALRYIGFDGSGRQVRDLLHVADQLARPEHLDGVVANVGGGVDVSPSLLETTALCQELSGREVPLTPVAEGRPGDVPVYLSDCTRLFRHTNWRPRHTPRDVLADTWNWICEHESALKAAL